MRASIRFSAISRLGGAVAAIWLCATGSASAGDGGGDIPSAQKDVAALCTQLFNMTCPQLPTITQLILQIAGLENTSPDIARYAESFSPTVAVNAVNPPAGNNPFDLTKVTPVAFVPSTTGGTATVTVPDDPAAKSFFYAATDGAPGTPPANLILVYDYLQLKNSNFAKDQPVAKLSLPLVILNTSNNTETEAPTTILIAGATGCGKPTPTTPCVSATATGSFGTVSADSLGINVTLDFSLGYARFTVQAPLLVTKTTDPAYFTTNAAYCLLNPPPPGAPSACPAQFFYPGLPTSFINNVGVTNIPKSLGSPIGVAPYAAPQCPIDPNTGKPQLNCANASPLPKTKFPFCASILTDGTKGSIFPAVAAFYSIGTFGTTYVSAPTPKNTPTNVSCPF